MWGQIAGAALGALVGGQGDTKTRRENVILAPESQLEQRGGQVALDQLNQLQSMLGGGANAQDFSQGAQSQRDLAAMLGQFTQGGFMPGQQDISQAGSLAQQLFQGQQVGLNQAFDTQRQQASRNAARMGRSAIDPVLQNQLMQGQARMQQQLNADIGAFGTNLAMNMPQQRLQAMQQLARVQQGLASQAMANRQALLGLGSQLRGQEQNFRANTASREGSLTEGGGLGGMISGAVSGVGMGQGLSDFGNFIGGGLSQAGSWLSRQFSRGPSTPEGKWYRG